MSVLKDRIEALIEKYEKDLKTKSMFRERHQTILDITDAEIAQLENTIFDLRFAIQGGTIYSRDEKEPTVIEPAEKEIEK